MQPKGDFKLTSGNNVRTVITDAPPSKDSGIVGVEVTITGAKIHTKDKDGKETDTELKKKNGKPVSLGEEALTVDLMKLAYPLTEVLGDIGVSGQLIWAKLKVSHVKVVYEDGSSREDCSVPSGELKVNLAHANVVKNLEDPKDPQITLTIDFDPNRSLVYTGNANAGVATGMKLDHNDKKNRDTLKSSADSSCHLKPVIHLKGVSEVDNEGKILKYTPIVGDEDEQENKCEYKDSDGKAQEKVCEEITASNS